jgi:D-inositol-3-phosphate glycosyltransferase
MNICLIAESYPPAVGGVEFALQKLVDGFVARGHQVRVIASSWQGHAPSVEHCGNLTIIRIHTLPFLKRFWFLFLSLPSVIRSARWADIVQGSTFAGGPPAFLGAWLAGKKKALIVHEVLGVRWFQFEPNPVRSLFYVLTERIIVGLPFDHYIAPSQYTKNSLRSLGVPEGKISVIHHGDSKHENPAIAPTEVRSRLGFQQDDFVFMTYGRTGVTKGFELFADAIPEIANQIPGARFVLVLAQYDSRISERIQRATSVLAPGICKLLPPMSRAMLAGYVSAADCIVVPSLSEGFGFSALEACNANKIVVSTDAGSLPEVVFGKHVFVKPGSAQALAQGCVKAYRGEVSITLLKIFSWEKAVGEYLKLYAQLQKSDFFL